MLRSTLITLGLFAGLGLSLSFVAAQENENKPLLDYRQNLMVGQRASMASMGDILKFKMPYDAAHFAAHARNIGGYAALIPDAFETKIAEGRTDAKPEIWDNWDDFVAKAKALGNESEKLAAAAATGDMKAVAPHVKAVSDACRGCHDSYRKPEDQRFKR
jgi:cytochrome c556